MARFVLSNQPQGGAPVQGLGGASQASPRFVRTQGLGGGGAGSAPQFGNTLRAAGGISSILGSGVNMLGLSPTLGGSLGTAGSLIGGAGRALGSTNDLQRGLNAAGGAVGALSGAGRIPEVASAIPGLASFSKIPGIGFAGPVLGFGADLAGGADPGPAAFNLATNAGLAALGPIGAIAKLMSGDALGSLSRQLFGGKSTSQLRHIQRTKEADAVTDASQKAFAGLTPENLQSTLNAQLPGGIRLGDALTGFLDRALRPENDYYRGTSNLPAESGSRPYDPETIAPLHYALQAMGYRFGDPRMSMLEGIGEASSGPRNAPVWFGNAGQVANQLSASNPQLWQQSLGQTESQRASGPAINAILARARDAVGMVGDVGSAETFAPGAKSAAASLIDQYGTSEYVNRFLGQELYGRPMMLGGVPEATDAG